MRAKGGLEKDYLHSTQWRDRTVRNQRYSTLEFERIDGIRKPVVNSISGLEKNKLFINQEGQNFYDASLWSGTDSVADGRCFAIWDYDHDGRQDIALINMNDPHLQIFRNRHFATNRSANRFVAVRTVGGNSAAETTQDWSNRSGVGAKVYVQCDQRKMIREQRCGEGFSTQNSATLIIGLGEHALADTVSIEWPSGKQQSISEVPSGSLVTFYENQADAPYGQGAQVEKYVPVKNVPPSLVDHSPGLFDYDVNEVKNDGADLRVMITMATWCTSCKKHQRPLEDLKNRLDDRSKVAFYAIPIDVEDTPEKLKTYTQRHQVPYRIIHELDDEQRLAATDYVRSQLRAQALPCTIICDGQGRALHSQFGIPTLSDIRRLQEQISALESTATSTREH